MVQPPNYTQVPNDHLDNLRFYDPSEFRLLMTLDRLTFGFHRKAVKRSVRKLSEITGLSPQTIQAAAARLSTEQVFPDGTVRPAQISRSTNGVTEWEMLVVWSTQDQQTANDAKRVSKPGKTDEPKADLQPLAQAIEQVTGVPLADQRARIFSEAKKLYGRYTPDQITTVFGPNGPWYLYDFRGKQGSRPSISQVRSEIHRLLTVDPTSQPTPKPAPSFKGKHVELEKDGFYL